MGLKVREASGSSETEIPEDDRTREGQIPSIEEDTRQRAEGSGDGVSARRGEAQVAAGQGNWNSKTQIDIPQEILDNMPKTITIRTVRPPDRAVFGKIMTGTTEGLEPLAIGKPYVRRVRVK